MELLELRPRRQADRGTIAQLTDAQLEAVEKAGIEVAMLRLAAMARSEPRAAVTGYCDPPPPKSGVEEWLNARTRRTLAKNVLRAVAAGASVMIAAVSVWGLLGEVGF